MDFNIPQELKKLPHLPGVYIMKDESDQIIYVGKAVDINSRVKNYFSASVKDPKTRRLSQSIHHFEYVVTDSENEAFILENTLIKLHRPKFNIRLKDDKAYPYIKITRETMPRIMYSHRRMRDKAKYYGPFISRSRVRELLELIHKLWPLRKCSKIFPRDFGKARPCLNHHIGQCAAPCARLLNEEGYNAYLAEAERFIQGKTDGIMARLSKEMAAAAESLEFEKAADLRDTISALEMLTEKQKVETGGDDRDIIAMAKKDDEALMQIFFLRDGKLSGREHYIMGIDQSTKDGDIMAAFIKQFYSEAAFIPKELSLICKPAEQDSITAWLSGLAGRQVAMTTPQKGEKFKMVKLAQTNAALTLSQFGGHIKKEAQRNATALSEIIKAIGAWENGKKHHAEAKQLATQPASETHERVWGGTPFRIESYDISNIQGYESVGSMIVFEDGKSKNSDYRKFRLRAVIGPDDYAGMEEIITRRLRRHGNATEGDSFSKLPDVIFVDGGKGQITAAKKALASLGLAIPVCGMVKDDRHRTRALLYEGKELTLLRTGEGFKLVTRIQDEVHRFALEYHHKLRQDSQVRSILDDIPGIGKTRRRELLKHFKNMEAIAGATIDELESAPSMNKKTAKTVYDFFANAKGGSND
ncbi:MAG: excinuclease ABC subunit UvrC [Defluviitaleaceae bacterium]|nr:excinuclease ABC subunit UvrC [Defluviitaleaceae bacterium]